MLDIQISTTTSAGEQAGISGSPVKNDDHLSPTPGGLELFPLKEEGESFHGDESVFNVTFSGPVQKSVNGNTTPKVSYLSNDQDNLT